MAGIRNETLLMSVDARFIRPAWPRVAIGAAKAAAVGHEQVEHLAVVAEL